MKTKMLVIFVVCLGLLALMPSVSNASTITVQSRGQNQGQFNTISSASTDAVFPNILQVQSDGIGGYTRGLFYMDFIFDVGNVTSVRIALRTFQLHEGGSNISVYSINDTKDWNPGQVTWDTQIIDTGMYTNWTVPGGDYEHTKIDTVLVDNGASWYYWDITQYYFNSVANESTTTYYGFIFVSDNTDGTLRGASFVGGSSGDRDRYPKMVYNYTYSAGDSNIYKDVWNLKGYAGSSPKLASTIYSDITNCTAISWKNATTGYWYTYYPSLGLTEDAYLEFGDGLFILTSEDTTWDHT